MNVEQKARELLAAELLASGHEVAASHIISAGKSCLDDVELAALRAIARALEQPEGRAALTEQQKADRDAVMYGTGFMLGGKHIPAQDVTIVQAPQQPEAQAGVVRVEVAVVSDLMDALHSFAATAEDDECYTVSSELMSRLAMLGAVYRAKREGWYYLTDFGRMLLAAQQPKEGAK